MMTQYSRKIFVGRVSEDLQKADLKDYFSKYGEVRTARPNAPHEGKEREIDFLSFRAGFVHLFLIQINFVLRFEVKLSLSDLLLR